MQSARPALAATVPVVLLQHDDDLKGLAEHFAAAMPAMLPPMTTTRCRARGSLNIPRVVQPSPGGAAARRFPLATGFCGTADDGEAIVVQPGSGCVDHGDRTTQVCTSASPLASIARQAGR